VTTNVKKLVANNLGVKQVSGTSKYLGIPSMVGKR